MANDLDKILDECMDRINRGERLEDCLACYPEHAEELEPLLRAMLDTQAAYIFTPSPTTKQQARQRFNVALEELVRRREEKRVLFPEILRQSRAWVTVAAVFLVALIGYFGLRPMLFPAGPEPGPFPIMPSPQPSPEGNEVNFRFLISDEENAIGDFKHLWIEISEIGLQRGGESGNWTEPKDFAPVKQDLVPENFAPVKADLVSLQGDNAQLIWSGNVTAGEYTGVFIYVSNIWWELNSNGDSATTGQDNGGPKIQIKLPSEKLRIHKNFTVGENSTVDFIYDVTVIKAGKSGQYIIQPQVDQSGTDQPFTEVTSGGKPRDTGKPEDKGKPDDKGKPEVEEAKDEEFEGIIVSISDNWTMEIRGEMWVIDVSEADIEGDPEKELEAEVKGTVVADRTVKATEVEIKED